MQELIDQKTLPCVARGIFRFPGNVFGQSTDRTWTERSVINKFFIIVISPQ